MSAPAEPTTPPPAARVRPSWCAAVRRFVPPLFGPILFYDLVSTARRGRCFVVRMLYVAALLMMLFLLYAEWFGRGGDLVGMLTAERIDRGRVSAFNDSFFQMFMAVQYLVIVLLTPGVTAGAIADEKERRTLEHLLATDLSGYEIVFGKLAARLSYLALILLAGLPVLSLLQLLGGLDPQMLLAGFAVTGGTMLSLASLSILNSVYATKARTAIALTYAQAALYFGVTTCALWVWDPLVKAPWGVGMPPWARWACAGNAYVALKNLQAALMAGGGGAGGVTLVSHLPGVLLGYAAFHLSVMAVCLLGSLIGLRLWARWQASGGARKAYVIALTQWRLPRVSARPMLWKELYAEPLIRLGEAAQIVITTGVAMTLLFAALALVAAVTFGLTLGNLSEVMNPTVRLMGTGLASLMVLGAALRAAGAISGERDRQTMDTLLTTPVENDSVVWAKWWGSVLGARKAGYVLLVVWLVGAATGGLSVAALPLLPAALFIYLAFAASLGLWFSLRCRTTLRATLWTMATLLGAGAGHWVLTLFCCSPLGPGGAQSSGATAPGTRVLALVQKYTLTPPATLSALAFRDADITGTGGRPGVLDEYEYSGESALRHLAFGLPGILLYGIAAVVLLLQTKARFGPVMGRLPLPGARPTRAPPRKRAVARG